MKVILVVIGGCCLMLGVFVMGVDAVGMFVNLHMATHPPIGTGVMATTIGALAIDRGRQHT